MNAKSVSQVCALILLAANVALAAPVTYYVKNGGLDSESGLSDTKAWATIAKVNTEFANGTFKAGDSILLKCGSMWAKQLVITQSGDTTDGDITIGAYGSGEKPILGYSGKYTGWTATFGRTDVYQASVTPQVYIANEYLPPTELGAAAGYFRIYRQRSDLDGVEDNEGSFWWTGGTLYVHAFDDTDLSTTTVKEIYGNEQVYAIDTFAAVDVSNEEYITVQNLHLACSATGVLGDPANNITVNDCRLSGTVAGVFFDKEGTTESDQISIHDNDSQYNGNGLKFKNSGNITVYDNTLAHTWIRRGQEDREGTGFNDCHDLEVYGNDIFDTMKGIVVYVAGTKANFYVHHNYVHGTVRDGISLGGPGTFDDDVHVYHNVTWIPLNTVFDPEGGSGDPPQGIKLSGVTASSTEPFQLWNNTIRARPGLRMNTGVKINLKLYNNIFYDCEYHILDDATAITAAVHERNKNIFNVVSADPIHKIYWGGGTAHGTMAAYQTAAYPQEAASIEDDPGFVSEPTNLRIASTGPANDVGVDPPGNVPFDPATALDFYAQAIGGVVSIGAAEPPPTP